MPTCNLFMLADILVTINCKVWFLKYIFAAKSMYLHVMLCHFSLFFLATTQIKIVQLLNEFGSYRPILIILSLLSLRIRVLASESQRKGSDALPCSGVLVVREKMRFSVWFLLVGDRKGIRPQKLCFSSSLLGRLPKVDLIILQGEKCPSVRTSVRPSTKSFFDFNEIWYVGRGRWVMHDSMPYDRIQGQGQGHEPFKVWIPSIFKTYLLCHLQ